MKKLMKYSKIILLIIDIIIVTLAVTISNLLLCEKGTMFSKENLETINIKLYTSQFSSHLSKLEFIVSDYISFATRIKSCSFWFK